MVKPYRFRKKLVKIGNSVGVTIPQIWFKLLGKRKVEEIIVEVFEDKVVIIPAD